MCFDGIHIPIEAVISSKKSVSDYLREMRFKKGEKRVLGHTPNEGYDDNDLISEKYQGIRPAPGYPTCPAHTEKPLILDLLKVAENTGITLTEFYAMVPTAAVSGLYFLPPDSRYFGLGKED